MTAKWKLFLCPACSLMFHTHGDTANPDCECRLFGCSCRLLREGKSQ